MTTGRLAFRMFCCLLAAAGAGFGCGDDSTAADAGDADVEEGFDGDGGDGAAGRCERDPVLLAEPRACVVDEDCPCGAHCALGRCAHDCVADGECGGGGWCDDFGRCRAAGDSARVALPLRQPRAVLSAEPDLLEFRRAGVEKAVVLRAAGRDAGPVRVVGGEGVEVACGGGAPFAEECGMDGIAAEGAGAVVRVRYVGEAATGEDLARQVAVFADGSRLGIGVRVRAPVVEAGPPADGSGIYSGFAWPVGAGFVSRPDIAPLSEELETLRLPVTLKVYPAPRAEYVLAFTDRRKALFVDEPTVGRLVPVTGGGWNLSIVRRLYVGSATPGDGGPEVTIDAQARSVRWHAGVLSVVLRTTFGGATTDVHAPYVDWRVALTWTAELPAGETAPALPAAYERSADPAARAAEALDVEAWTLAGLPSDLGADPAQRAAAAVCTAPGVGSTVRRFVDRIFVPAATGLPSPAGDLSCSPGPGDAPRTLPLLERGSFAVNDEVRTCLDDLERIGTAAGVPGSDGCIDAGRMIAAWSLAWADDRSRALGVPAPWNFGASALGHRLAQQWLDLHSMVVREALEVQQVNDILPEAERLAQEFTLTGALQAALDGWDLLLHPRFAAVLPVLPGVVLHAPDYRPRLFPSASYPASNSHEQPVGLAVALLRALRDQLDMLAKLVTDARSGLVRYADVEPYLTGFFRRSFVVLGLAQGLYDAARAVAEPDWQAEWEVARIDFGSGAARLLRALDDRDAGVNVLSIEDGDLPIYRVGDEVSANDRLSALSDYLLGVGADLRAVAPYMVNRAQGALDAARAAWVANVTRNYQAQLEAAEHERRMEGVNRRFGEQITSLCWQMDWDSATILARWDEVDPNTCYLLEECRPTGADLGRRANAADVGNWLCYAGRLRARFGENVSTGDEALDALIDEVGPTLDRPDEPFALRIVAADERGVGFAVGAREYWMGHEDFGRLEGRLPADLPGDVLEESRLRCIAGREATRAARPVERPAACALADDCPLDWLCADDGTCVPDPGLGEERAECYTGSIGELALATIAAAREVEIARSEAQELIDSYDVAMRTCIITRSYHDSMEQALARHNEMMTTLGAVKLAFQITANLAAATKDIATMSDPLSKAWGAGAAVAEATALSVVDGMDFAMEEAERAHEAEMMELEHALEDATCTNDAQMYLVGLRTAKLRVQQALLDQVRTWLELEGDKWSLRALLWEGHCAVENERNRRVDPLTTDYWLDENVERYRDALRQARRAAYLAAMAVEYEFQISTPERGRILAARTPAELQASIDRLRAVAMTGTIGGAAPGNLFTVISLRQHLLQLADRSAMPAGWQDLPPAERLRVWLSSRTNAVYDADGNYLGQEVPFSLQPLGRIGLGDPGGIPILAGTDCAERLWSVNASVLGDEPHIGGSSFTRVVLRKRNTFYSQWCGGAHDVEFQVASTRPSRNLFLDPYGWEESLTPATPQPDRTSIDETNAYSNARISAYFNVSRAELEDERYFNGDSQELAGRGLYGDYALFFPAETLSDGRRDGLVLNRVDDVLLRFDYVSVARGRP